MEIQETFEIIFALITAFVFFFRVQLFTFLGFLPFCLGIIPYQGTYTRHVSELSTRRLARNPYHRGLPDTDYDYDILVIQETFEIIFALITAFVFFFRVQLFTFLGFLPFSLLGANVVSLLVI
jgi:hypothetical protein